jgi:MFS family permease
MTTLDAMRWRYLLLVGLRWLPVGFMIPIFVLVPLSRGLSLTEIGLVMSVQGLVVLALELPTGGLSDSLGRRPVLILASVLGVLSLTLFSLATTAVLFVVAMFLQGIYRALDSGPLEAWYVDATLAADPDAPIERGLGHGSSILSAAIAVGALASGGLVALHPIAGIDPFAVPLAVAVALHVVHLAAVMLVMTEAPRARDRRAMAASVRAVPGVIADGIRLLRGSRVISGLIAVEAFWGFSMVTFEGIFPIRLADLVGGTDQAAAIMGPVGSAAWFAAALGSALVVGLSGRLGVARSAAILRIVQGATIVLMGWLAGPVGVIAAYLACYVAHGASNPMHTTLLHRQVDGPHRTTVLSMNSMIGQPAGSLGAIVLASLADGTSVATAMVVGGIICALAAPLYIPAWRQERRRRAHAAASAPGSGSDRVAA